MEIKVGDKVRVSSKLPRIYERFGSWIAPHYECEVVEIEEGMALLDSIPARHVFLFPLKYLTKVEDEAKEPKFKVGDKVKDISSPHDSGIYKVDDIKKSSDGFLYHIQGLIGKSNVKESDLAPYTEPTAPTIKVGDFVRVLENLHEPICLDVERHLEITNMPPHAVSQKEWKVISVEMRRDCAGRIYTLKHDDSFIYNIPEDCVELVQPKEQTEAENINPDDFKKIAEEWANEVSNAIEKYGDAMCKIYVEARNEAYWDAYAADLAKEIAVKLSKPNENKPGYVADYAVSVAKAVVENLKKK